MTDPNRKYALRFTNEDFPLCVPHSVIDHVPYRQVVYCDLTLEEFRQMRSEHHINLHQYVKVELDGDGGNRDVMVPDLLCQNKDALQARVIRSLFKTIGGEAPADAHIRSNALAADEMGPEAARCLLTFYENYQDPVTECDDEDIWDMVDNYGLELWDFYKTPQGDDDLVTLSASNPDWATLGDLMASGIATFKRRFNTVDVASIGIPDSPMGRFRSQCHDLSDDGGLPPIRKAVVMADPRGMAAAIQLERNGEVKAAAVFGGSEALAAQAERSLQAA